MSLIRGAVERRGAVSSLSKPAAWLRAAAVGDAVAPSGATVGIRTALAHADVYACIRALADAGATLPLITYKRTATSRDRAPMVRGTTAWLMEHPSPTMTQSALIGSLIVFLNAWGNAFLAKYRDQSGAVVQLGVISPNRVSVKIVGGEPIYTITPGDGSTLQGEFNRRDILHIKAMSVDGVLGMSPIQQARGAIGLAMTLEEAAGRDFANGTFPGGVLSSANSLSDTAWQRLKRDWEATHRGTRKRGRVALLENGVTYTPMGMPATDAQFVEQRHLSAQQIARIFRVPPWVIAAESGRGMTYANVEQQTQMFVTHSVRPWLVTIEQAFAADEDLYPPDGTTYPEFLMEALLRGDTTARSASYSLGFGKWLTPNDIRRSENLPDLPNGDEMPAPPAAIGGEAAPAPKLPEPATTVPPDPFDA